MFSINNVTHLICLFKYNQGLGTFFSNKRDAIVRCKWLEKILWHLNSQGELEVYRWESGSFMSFSSILKGIAMNVKTNLIGEESFYLLDVKGRLIESTKTCLSLIFVEPPLGEGAPPYWCHLPHLVCGLRSCPATLSSSRFAVSYLEHMLFARCGTELNEELQFQAECLAQQFKYKGKELLTLNAQIHFNR